MSHCGIGSDKKRDSYGTEGAVGKAIKESGVPREEIFLVSKLWNNKHHPDDVEDAFNASLRNLGVDYLDLYLMHWPSAFARGDEVFPKDASGKPKIEKFDYVDVSVISSAVLQMTADNAMFGPDIQSNGEAAKGRKGQSHWRFKLLQNGDGAFAEER